MHRIERGLRTALYPFARTCNVNPYLPGQWNRESAQIVAGPSGSVSPRGGDGMLQMNSSCSASQVNQIIALPSPPPSDLTYSIYVNSDPARSAVHPG